MVKQAFKKITDLLLLQGQSVSGVTFASCVGIFIALSPFIGLHTIMIFAFSWLLNCNVAIVFTVVYLVSNPITMVPLLAIEYIFGDWFFKDILRIDLLKYNPSWMDWFNAKVGHYLSDYLGIGELNFWAFIVGGTIFALLGALIAYPGMKRLFTYIADKKNIHENNSTE